MRARSAKVLDEIEMEFVDPIDDADMFVLEDGGELPRVGSRRARPRASRSARLFFLRMTLSLCFRRAVAAVAQGKYFLDMGRAERALVTAEGARSYLPRRPGALHLCREREVWRADEGLL